MLIHEILEYTAGRLPDKLFLAEDDRELTYADALAGSRALAVALRDRGVAPGDRVALLFPNCIDFCLAYFGVLLAGGVVVPLNNRLAPRELAYILGHSQAATIIVHQQFWESWNAVRPDLDGKFKVIKAEGESTDEAEDFADLIQPGPQPDAPPPTKPHDPASIMYTSGTTGLPKGAVLSHKNVFTNARNAGAHLGYKESDVTLLVVPLFHVTGLHSQLVAFAYVGGTCAVMRAYNTARMIELIAKHKVTVTFNVPTMYTLMLVNETLDRYDISGLRLAAYGGAPMAPETIVQLQKRLGVDLYNAYGLTEATSLVTVLPACDALRKAGSIGLPTSGTRLKTVDDRGREMEANQVGELYIKAPIVVSGYWRNPEATAENITDGWLHTGDYARIDPEGFVFIADRKKDMIIRGGENIYSIEVESALVSHPKVLEAAVVPRPHSIFDEVVHAFVVLK
jgi:acyl-CoA synthetase (AMP-forming)/AMP-acid ligase II